MGMAAPREQLGGWSPRPPQKFAGQLLSRKQVLQKKCLGFPKTVAVINDNTPGIPTFSNHPSTT